MLARLLLSVQLYAAGDQEHVRVHSFTLLRLWTDPEIELSNKV